MEPFVFLLVLGIAMFLGSYGAGSLPLSTKLSERKIKMFNALGAGLLIGTSLMVVIPEGANTIYQSRATEMSNLNLPSSQINNILNETDLYYNNNNNSGYEIVTKRAPKPTEAEEGNEHRAIGLALIVGFSLMFIIDQISSLHMSNDNSSTIEYAELSTVVGGEALENEEAMTPVDTHPKQVSMTPTVGLVVHAAADGIALGASVSHPQLSIVVFFAIMLHKAPASFALSSVLLAGGLPHNIIRKHLLIFSMAAPLGSILTYLILSLFSSGLSSSLEYWTGVLLVFSGGTFLYVAMHALQEAIQENHHHHTNSTKDSNAKFLVLAGMLIPVLLSFTDTD